MRFFVDEAPSATPFGQGPREQAVADLVEGGETSRVLSAVALKGPSQAKRTRTVAAV